MDKNMIAHSWLKILICSLALLIGPIFASTNPVHITYLESAVEKGAVCLDGSPPAYYFDKGYGEGANNWMIYLEGGYWCGTNSECWWYKYICDYGGCANTTKRGNSYTLQGIRSQSQDTNPEFYNWNKVHVSYCDGALFSGNVEQIEEYVAANGTSYKIYHRGARIFQAVIDDLLEKGMKNADNAILMGGSAGALATLLHCDNFRNTLPNTKRVKCIIDSGFFIHAPDLPGSYERREKHFNHLVENHGLLPMLPSTCTSKMAPGLCLFPENIVGDIKTPLFLVDSLFDQFQLSVQIVSQGPQWDNCTTIDSYRQLVGDPTLCLSNQTSVQLIKDFRTEFLKALPKDGSISMFIDTCFIHGHTHDDYIWTHFTLKNTTLAKAIGDWYFDRNSFNEIDLEHDYPRKC